jgi:hypothetical protein
MRWIAVTCAALIAAAPLAAAQAPQPASQAITAAMTCAELEALIKAHYTQTVGVAILWLDGVYSGKTGKTAIPAGWASTLGGAVGGTCAIDVNAARTVLDVVGEVHQRYAPAK